MKKCTIYMGDSIIAEFHHEAMGTKYAQTLSDAVSSFPSPNEAVKKQMHITVVRCSDGDIIFDNQSEESSNDTAT